MLTKNTEIRCTAYQTCPTLALNLCMFEMHAKYPSSQCPDIGTERESQIPCVLVYSCTVGPALEGAAYTHA